MTLVLIILHPTTHHSPISSVNICIYYAAPRGGIAFALRVNHAVIMCNTMLICLRPVFVLICCRVRPNVCVTPWWPAERHL